jgi:hypothetical protein
MRHSLLSVLVALFTFTTAFAGNQSVHLQLFLFNYAPVASSIASYTTPYRQHAFFGFVTNSPTHR